ncbi:STAS domain-containing protein [Patescibacteria group bacterium]|nr:STAS domain-containing protein [Patescibacteria group bacterium]MBU1682959.1 STAS domain-containing protein [Patescibacteria group bacterium]MBU1934871.1 STAS domain-containing protein [Patescibacteria group bacterium]
MAEKLVISIEALSDHPNVHVVEFDGDFDGYAKENVTDVQSFVDSATNNTTLIFDFSKLNYLNSYAIGHLVAWHNHLSKMGGKIFIAGTNKNVEDIFAILGIAKLFKIFPDVNSVIETL